MALAYVLHPSDEMFFEQASEDIKYFQKKMPSIAFVSSNINGGYDLEEEQFSDLMLFHENYLRASNMLIVPEWYKGSRECKALMTIAKMYRIPILTFEEVLEQFS